jgi:signal transduction histidine kinase/ActR/RegA family two-component response regulator
MIFKSSATSQTDSQFEGGLIVAQAKYLRENLYVANVGTTAIILLMTYFFWGEDLAVELTIWIVGGVLSCACRSALMYFYRSPNCFEGRPEVAKLYLHLYTMATSIAGLTFAWGWLTFVPYLSSYEQLIYLLSIVALLFGGLFAYSPYFPAYIGFSSTAFWLSPLFLTYSSEIYITGLTFGIWLISLVSTMFAYRFSNTFKTNRSLEFNIYKLLSEVTKNRDEAISANLAKSRFLASVSHDLRQPMQAVSLSLNTLQQLILYKLGGEKSQQMVEENLAGLQHSVQYLNSMFEALLDISRLDSGVLNVQMEYQPIDHLFKSMEYEYFKIAQEEGVQFKASVPPEFQTYQVNTDIHLLERLLRNLITNAIRYTPTGGVRLAARVKGKHLDIRIVDTGLGIPVEMRSKVFEEFTQIHSGMSKDKNVGMGLGLAIARRLSGLIGTTIRLSTHKGIGSVFAFKLKFKKLPALRASELVKSVGEIKNSIENLLILIVDDDPKILQATKVMLELYGAEVIAGDSSDSVIQQAVFNPRIPNLILSDYRLVEETGLECIERIRHEYNVFIPAVIITGNTAPEELGVLKKAGFQVLYKPINPDMLLELIAGETSKLS